MTQIAHDTGLGCASFYEALPPDGSPEFEAILELINVLELKLHVSTRSV